MGLILASICKAALRTPLHLSQSIRAILTAPDRVSASACPRHPPPAWGYSVWPQNCPKLLSALCHALEIITRASGAKLLHTAQLRVSTPAVLVGAGRLRVMDTFKTKSKEMPHGVCVFYSSIQMQKLNHDESFDWRGWTWERIWIKKIAENGDRLILITMYGINDEEALKVSL